MEVYLQAWGLVSRPRDLGSRVCDDDDECRFAGLLKAFDCSTQYSVRRASSLASSPVPFWGFASGSQGFRF